MNTPRDRKAEALRDAAHDAFMALWRSAERDQALLCAAYLAAQERYDAYLQRRS
jgi:hypothetical protein